LARGGTAYKLPLVSAFLRIVGIVNAAIWFGGGVFFAFGILPGVFSNEMRQLFGETGYSYYSGAVALALFKRFFVMQYVCGAVALIHLVAEKLYLGRPYPGFGAALVGVLLFLGLLGGLWLQPRMTELRGSIYSSSSTAEQKERARHSFAVWHGISQGANLFIMAGILVHLLRVTRPPDSGRYGVLFPQFRG